MGDGVTDRGVKGEAVAGVREGRGIVESSSGGETTLPILTWMIISEMPVIVVSYTFAMKLVFPHRKISQSRLPKLLSQSKICGNSAA